MYSDAYRAIRASYSRKTRARGRSGRMHEHETKEKFFERAIDPGVRLPVKILSGAMKTKGSCEGHPHGVGHPHRHFDKGTLEVMRYSHIFGRAKTQDAMDLSKCMESHGFDKFINIDKLIKYARHYNITCPRCETKFVGNGSGVEECPGCEKILLRDRGDGTWEKVPSETRMHEDEFTYQIMLIQYDEDPPGTASIRFYIFPKFRFTTETLREIQAMWDEARDRGWSAVIDTVGACLV